MPNADQQNFYRRRTINTTTPTRTSLQSIQTNVSTTAGDSSMRENIFDFDRRIPAPVFTEQDSFVYFNREIFSPSFRALNHSDSSYSLPDSFSLEEDIGEQCPPFIFPDTGRIASAVEESVNLLKRKRENSVDSSYLSTYNSISNSADLLTRQSTGRDSIDSSELQQHNHFIDNAEILHLNKKRRLN